MFKNLFAATLMLAVSGLANAATVEKSPDRDVEKVKKEREAIEINRPDVNLESSVRSSIRASLNRIDRSSSLEVAREAVSKLNDLYLKTAPAKGKSTTSDQVALRSAMSLATLNRLELLAAEADAKRNDPKFLSKLDKNIFSDVAQEAIDGKSADMLNSLAGIEADATAAIKGKQTIKMKDGKSVEIKDANLALFFAAQKFLEKSGKDKDKEALADLLKCLIGGAAKG